MPKILTEKETQHLSCNIGLRLTQLPIPRISPDEPIIDMTIRIVKEELERIEQIRAMNGEK